MCVRGYDALALVCERPCSDSFLVVQREPRVDLALLTMGEKRKYLVLNASVKAPQLLFDQIFHPHTATKAFWQKGKSPSHVYTETFIAQHKSMTSNCLPDHCYVH